MLNLGFDSLIKENLSNLIFCFQNGNLIYSLGLKPNVSNRDDFEREIVRFYSMKMLVLHCSMLKDDAGAIEKLTDEFMKTHQFESLSKFVYRTEPNTTQIVSKSIVLTHSQTRKHRFGDLEEVAFGINEIDQNGTTWFEAELKVFLDSNCKSRLFIVEVNDAKRMHLVEYIKHVIDNCVDNAVSTAEFEYELHPAKQVLIIVYKPLQFGISRSSVIRDVGYFNDDWRYQVIDDLEHSPYAQNLALLSCSSQEIFSKLRNGGCSELLTQLFVDSVKDMQVRLKFETYLKDQILPALRRQMEILECLPTRDARAKNEKSFVGGFEGRKESIELGVVELVGRRIFLALDWERIPNWSVQMFSNRYLFENVCSIRKCVVTLCKNRFERRLKKTFKHLVEAQGISSLICLQNWPRQSKGTFESIFSETLDELLRTEKWGNRVNQKNRRFQIRAMAQLGQAKLHFSIF